MKKKSASRSGFFNLRVLIGLFVVLTGVFLALAGLGTFSASAFSPAKAPQKHKILNIQGLPPGFDCSRIYELGKHTQENLGAGLIMIACGEAAGGSAFVPTAFSQLIQQLLPEALTPLAYGDADVDVITRTENFPSVTQ